MRALIQRVQLASVSINGIVVSSIGPGLLLFLGVSKNDSEIDANYVVNKLTNLRTFPDKNGQFEKSVLDINGEILVVSQFTLFGDTRKGNRPSFTEAEIPSRAQKVYNNFLDILRSTGLTIQTGMFGENMLVDIKNDGPVTLLVDSKNRH